MMFNFIIIGLLIGLTFLVLSFIYHVYKLDSLIRYMILGNTFKVKEFLDQLDFKGGKNNVDWD